LPKIQQTKLATADTGDKASDRLRRYFCWRLGRAGGRAGGQAASLFLLATRVGGGGWITELVEHIGQRHSNIHTEQAATHYLATLATVHIASRAQMPP